MTGMTTPLTWEQHQAWERAWWGDCSNTFSEENKQITYAHRMGLVNEPDPYTGAWPSYDLAGRDVLDIGGGPTSLLLKCRNRGAGCWVADPCVYPPWTEHRYHTLGIHVARDAGEEIDGWDPSIEGFAEVWIYNVLQHTRSPQRIVANARQLAPVLRIFEWIDTPPEPGHPHTLTAAGLDAWCGGRGTVEVMDENGCTGAAWYGVFTS